MTAVKPRYRSVSSWLKETFGEPVRKISLDAGLGCPNRNAAAGLNGCIFCNPRGSGTGAQAQGLSISEQVNRGVTFLSARSKCRKFIAYFQAFTNTYGTPDHLGRLYDEALRRPEIVALAVGTRPDCVPDAVLDLLADRARSHLVWVEYGLQSIHSRTLNLIRRGHDQNVFLDAVRRTQERGILTAAHLILGLPGESVSDMVQTAEAVAAARVHGVKLHPLYVIRGSELEHMVRSGDYRAMTEEQALEATLAVLEVLPPETVIHRMTSDPHPQELIEPVWMLDKAGVRKRLLRAMEERNLVQGSRFPQS
ncbi:MAG TPA: TIGR01212 family radical SAM protein [Desulfomonilaceae bacterium]|nr:TIGR01212 family radical SAM protein [Desulfomonilaceae bacterium]